jgi:hypothetical protein
MIKRPRARCAQCGRKFGPVRSDARYCSNRCRQAAHRQRVTDSYKRPPRDLDAAAAEWRRFEKDRLGVGGNAEAKMRSTAQGDQTKEPGEDR